MTYNVEIGGKEGEKKTFIECCIFTLSVRI